MKRKYLNLLIVGCLFLVSYATHIVMVKQTAVPTVKVFETKVIIPDNLIVTMTSSAYAHAQHLVHVEGRYRHKEGELYMTLLDTKGNKLQKVFTKAEIVKPIDEEWSLFQHKLVEETMTTVDIDEAIVVFELRKNGKVVKRGELRIPMEKP